MKRAGDVWCNRNSFCEILLDLCYLVCPQNIFKIIEAVQHRNDFLKLSMLKDFIEPILTMKKAALLRKLEILFKIYKISG